MEGREQREGARLSYFLFTKTPNQSKIIKKKFLGGGVLEGGGGGWSK